MITNKSVFTVCDGWDFKTKDGWVVSDDFILYSREFFSGLLKGLFPPCLDVGDGFEFDICSCGTKMALGDFIKVMNSGEAKSLCLDVESVINAITDAEQTLNAFIDKRGEAASEPLFMHYYEHPELYVIGWDRNRSVKIFIFAGIVKVDRPPVCNMKHIRDCLVNDRNQLYNILSKPLEETPEAANTLTSAPRKGSSHKLGKTFAVISLGLIIVIILLLTFFADKINP
ncbi:MAG: hypothetical protein FWG50_03485 [Kiritimatiellaeota bacterium]|nr:hypothetical protein [Kiritimatiellota bacterium]